MAMDMSKSTANDVLNIAYLYGRAVIVSEDVILVQLTLFQSIGVRFLSQRFVVEPIIKSNE